jgi:hypothetical protein
MTRPLGSTPITGASSLLRKPVRQPDPRRYSHPCSAWVTPYLPPSKKARARSIGSGLLPFHAKASDRARVASMPDTAWPINGHPPDSSRDNSNTPVSNPPDLVSTRQQRFACARLPGPRLTHPCAPFPHRSPRSRHRSRSMRWFEASPRRATPKGQILHLLHSTASESFTYIELPSTFGTHWNSRSS